MKRRQKAVILSSLPQLEKLRHSISEEVFTLDTDETSFGFFLSGSSKEAVAIICAGQSSFGSRRKDGPLTHRKRICAAIRPRLRSSAGLASVGTWFHRVGDQVDCISATRTPTNGLRSIDSDYIQWRTMHASVLKWTRGFSRSSVWSILAKREAMSAAINSSRGIVVWRRGATLAFAANRQTHGPWRVFQSM